MKYILAKCNGDLKWGGFELKEFKFMNFDFRKRSFREKYRWYSDGYDIILNDRKTGDNWYLRKASKTAVKCDRRVFEKSKSMVNTIEMFNLKMYGICF